ncbi:MAG: phage portal protein [Dehalococcoidales bacterium]|nr:phage portal protein [Dehalococcoidales bacterium]
MNEDFNPAELNRRDTERLKGYKELLDFYHGLHWEGRERWGEKRLTFNYAKVFIDKVTSYLMSGVHSTVEPVEDSAEARSRAGQAEVVLYQVSGENNLEQLDFETEIDCAILGDACYKVIWDQEIKGVRITAPDIQGIYAWWVGDDTSKVWRVASKYTLGRDMVESLYKVKTRDKTASVIELWTARSFELWVDGTQVEKKANPYGFIPFVIYPNLREPKKFWGISDLSQIMEPQRELNRATSQLSKILELSGNPIAVLENVEESEDIAVRPGAVWNIPEDAKAYLLDLLQGGGVGLHIDYINLLYRILHDVSESPRAAFGGTERDLSGVALEIELQPLLQKVRRKRIIRTAVYNHRNRLILKLLERYRNENFGDNRLNMVWAPVLPQDLSRVVANEQTLIQSGIHSRRKAMDELGVEDPETEFNRWLEERETILRMNRELNSRLPRDKRRGRDAELKEEVIEETSP